MNEPKEIFNTSVEFGDGKRTEWVGRNSGQKDEHFEAWYHDGERRVPATLSILRNLPVEAYGTKEGFFMKADSQLISWKRRYFVVSGGLLTYFKEDTSTKPQGTIPLKDCSIDLPNDMRKSFLLKNRKEVNGYEIRVTHMSRRPFLLVFDSDAERKDWVQFLTSYIAHTYLSEQYLLAEKVANAEDGLYVTKLTSSTVSSQLSSADGKKRYLYIDWYSPDVKDWCLTYAAIKLALVTDKATGHQKLANLPSSSISMQSVLSISVDSFPSCDIIVELAASQVEFSPVSGSRESALTWCAAANAAMKLQEFSMPTSPFNGRPTLMKRNSAKKISDLRNMLQSPEEPRGYTRDDFLSERRSMNNKINAVSSLTVPMSLHRASASPPLQRASSLEGGPVHPLQSPANIVKKTLSIDSSPATDLGIRVLTQRSQRHTEPLSRGPATYSSDSELRRGSSLRRLSSMSKLLSGVLGMPNSDGNESTASDSGVRVGRRLSVHRIPSSGVNESGTPPVDREITYSPPDGASETERPVIADDRIPVPPAISEVGKVAVSTPSSPDWSSSSDEKEEVGTKELQDPNDEAVGLSEGSSHSRHTRHSSLHSSRHTSNDESEAKAANRITVLPGSSVIAVDYQSSRFLLAVSKDCLEIFPIKDTADSESSEGKSWKIALSDCMSADVDLNSTGLMRLTLKSTGPSAEARYVQWVVRSRMGHVEALNWMKSLRQLKLSSNEARGLL